MPQLKGYGRRAGNQTNLSIFASSPKAEAQPQIEVLEVANQLVALALEEPTRSLKQSPSAKRQILAAKSGNERVKTPRSELGAEKPTDHKSPAKPTPPDVRATETVIPRAASSPRVIVPRSKRDRPELSCRSARPTASAVVHDIYHEHTSSILCQSANSVVSFENWSFELAEHFAISKIAEASYGEVYRLSLSVSQPGLSRTDESVLKIIALKPPPSTLKRSKMTKAAKERLEMMSEPISVANEVRLMQHMACVPGFTNFRDVTVLKGRPGTAFVAAWSAWNKQRKVAGQDPSTYPDPGKKTSYSNDQLWAVIEMQDAGTDLERIRIDDLWMAWDCFWGVAITLAKGEQSAEFEHRDLHMGNICVSSPHLDAQGVYGHDMSRVDTRRKLGFTDLTTTLIDYTVSRALTSEVGDSATDDDVVAYMDLAKDEYLFTGDGAVEYQYDIYRYMRGLVYLDDAYANVDERWVEAEHSGRTWRDFHPRTNLVWLHFILHSLLAQLELNGKRTGGLGSVQAKRLRELQRALQSTARLLDPQKLGRSRLGSAADLVELALMKGWLDAEDILGAGVDDSALGR